MLAYNQFINDKRVKAMLATPQQTKITPDLYRESYHGAEKNARLYFVIQFLHMTNNIEVHFEGKIAQKAIIVKEGKALLLRDPRENRVIWEIPGGRMNIDEEPREAVAREIMEELGVAISVGEVVYMGQFIHESEGKRAFVIVYEASLVDETAEFVLSDAEVCEIAWVSKDELTHFELFPEYSQALDCYFAKQGQ